MFLEYFDLLNSTRLSAGETKGEKRKGLIDFHAPLKTYMHVFISTSKAQSHFSVSSYAKTGIIHFFSLTN